jgi:hypothetical protein
MKPNGKNIFLESCNEVTARGRSNTHGGGSQARFAGLK